MASKARCVQKVPLGYGKKILELLIKFFLVKIKREINLYGYLTYD